MADVINLADYRRANQTLVEMAMADLKAIWSQIDVSDGIAVRLVMEEILPGLIAEYGEAVAALAADRFDALREVAGAPGRFSASPAPPVDPERTIARMRWAITPIFQAQNPAQALANLDVVVDEYVKEPGRATLIAATELDPAKATWARVPTGASTCAWCLALASRGATYGSKESAEFREDGGKYHGKCDCQPTPVWNGDLRTLPSDYDSEALLEKYRKAEEAADNPRDFKSVLAALRAQNPGMH